MTEPLFSVYLLGTVSFDAALALQRRLVYQVSGEERGAALVLCEHPPLITVGREGSRVSILCDADELRARGWGVRWVNRGGGVFLHAPGQLAIYPVLSLRRIGLGVRAYLDRLHEALTATLADFRIRATAWPGQAGVWVRGRPVASVGVAVRNWVTYYGAALNVNPDPRPFRLVRCGGPGEPPMTTMEHERRGPVRSALVRERLVAHCADRFGLGPPALFFDHPALCRKATRDAIVTPS